MKTITNWFYSGLLFMMFSTVFSQGNITGIIIDSDLKLPLSGANIALKGTQTAVNADMDGKFNIKVPVSSGQLVISYVGFAAKNVNFKLTGAVSNLGTIQLTPDENLLQEIVVKTTVVDIAKDRKTPVAVSTIKAAEIKEKLGNQEFPEMLNTTPSVYATKAGGGFGDARINIRGFDQRNTAVLINGMPVNDMENGWVYWSNWAGLSDVTSAMQVQRGLGSSKLAISSVGGTINIVTKSSDHKEGGSISNSIGNNDHVKTQISYNTGKLSNGLSASVLYSNTFGNGYVDGTKYAGDNYFIALGYEFNKNHDIQFTITGAPQWHHQRTTFNRISDYIKFGGSENEPNIKYNSDWGYLRGEEYSWRRNFFHKPIASLNIDSRFSEKMKLSTVLYGSWGRGGGTGPIGNTVALNFRDATTGLIRFDDLVKHNTGGVVTGLPTLTPNSNGLYVNNRTKGATRRSSINSHDWYGVVMNLNTKLSDSFTLDFGIDGRTYEGFHYRNVEDRLGANAYFDNRDVNNPNRTLFETYSAFPSWNPFKSLSGQEKIEYDNDGNVKWYGAFTQLEYSKNNLSAFIQGAISNQDFKRIDYFLYNINNPVAGQPNFKTDWQSLTGGNVKAGLNYNININHNVFANAGYYLKQPLFDGVFLNNSNVVNPNLTNEKILGTEVGYGYRDTKLRANVNLYRTSWKDRFLRSNITYVTSAPGVTPVTTAVGSVNMLGVEQEHFGAELDFSYNITKKLDVKGMFSIGDWKYKGNVVSTLLDENNQPTRDGAGNIVTRTLFLNDVKVGDAAQTTASLGAAYEILERFKVDGNIRYVDNLYANINPNDFSVQNHKGSLMLPSYNLVDAGMSYKMLVGKDKMNSLMFRLNINNLLDKTYISESNTNIHIRNQGDFLLSDGSPNVPAYNTYLNNLKTYDGLDQTNRVFFGFGRTWNVSLNYNF